MSKKRKMLHYFIVNPSAGQGLRSNFVRNEIVPVCEEYGIHYEIYYTKGPGDAVNFVRKKAKKAKGAPLRFYACGGDGTLYEVVNGAYGFENTEIAVVPLGSGNDWIRLFGEPEVFLDIRGQLEGSVRKIDCIKAGNEIAINQASVGFCAEACAVQGQMKKLPGVSGHLSYTLGGIYCALKKLKNDFKLSVDGKEIEGPFVFVFAGNSRWYGSGVQCAPFALPDDGYIDFVVMKRRVPWPIIAKVMLIDWQNKGEHIHHRDCEYIRGKRLHISSAKPVHIQVDGECSYITEVDIELIKDGLNFVIPKGSSYLSDRRSGKISGVIKTDKRGYLVKRGLI